MKTAVITGGSSGIGLATARLFSLKGYKVYELSRHGTSGDNITHIDCDITDDKQVVNAFDTIVAQVGEIDVLVNNAGMGISGPVEFTKEEDMKKQFDVNFFGMVRCVKAVLKYMRKQGFGKIINLSSVAAELSIPYQTFYSASKSAVNAFTLATANEVKPFNIKVCAIMPGDVATGFTANREKSQEGADVYKPLNKSIATMERDEINGLTPEYIAKRIYKQAKKKSPKVLTICGISYKFFVILAKFLPVRFVNFIVGKLYS